MPPPAEPSPAEPPPAYVRTDEHGVMRVGPGRCRLDGVVYGFLAGESPESIRLAYPSLTLEQVYGAVAHYLARRDEVDAYLRRQEAIFDELKAESDRVPNAAVDRIRAFKAERQRQTALDAQRERERVRASGLLPTRPATRAAS